MLYDGIFDLFIRVIKAAREGRFISGNGADWYIRTETGYLAHINTTFGNVRSIDESVLAELGVEHVDHALANRLEMFLETTDIESYVGTPGRYDSTLVRQMIDNGKVQVLYTNGGQYTVLNGGRVVMYDMNVVDQWNRCRFYTFTRAHQWRYLRQMGFAA